MPQRLLPALLAAALGVGGLATSAPAEAAPSSPVQAAAADPGVSVSETPLVVVPASEARTDGEGSQGAPGAESVPDASPDAPPTPAPAETPAPAQSVDPGSGDVVADALVADGRVVTEAVETADVQTLGITWPEGAETADLAPQVRTREGDTWSDWSDLEVSDTSADPGSADAAHETRAGTDSFWIGEADAVQLAFPATAEGGPDDMKLTLVGSELVDPAAAGVQGEVEGASAAGDAVALSAVYRSDSAASVRTVASQPAVISRAQWGARGQICAPDVAKSLVGAVVHHTAGSNAYSTVAQAMQQIRNDQAYHIDGRGWCDLGYNFVVDKWGNIYEGRANSLTQPVIGVHAGGFNTGTVGVAMLGTYSSAPSAATQQAVGAIIGWRLGAYGVDPQGWMSYATGMGENSRFQNTTVSLPRVFGHRDVSYTACPGDGGQAALQNIRTIASQSKPGLPAAQASAVVRAMYQDLLGRAADASGLAKWSGQLQTGTPLKSVSTSLSSSREYASVRVQAVYRDVLGRAADDAGLRSWVDRVQAGSVPVDGVALEFMSRQEFYGVAGGTDEAFVARLYQVVLGRAASAAEQATWAERIPALGRAGVATKISGSQESAERQVKDYYQLYFGRAVDLGGLQKWSAQLRQNGAPTVRISLTSSAEYLTRSTSRFQA
ncbi:DUF4214 domain-containing protein [Cellulomonas sp. Y8]|uniref:DUF4214 domain-containing protein n=1 Tax=Cellulomonas sp. Y8 TaxID=2591145 RepID=UPI003D712E49